MLYDRAAKTTKDLLPRFDRWVDEFAWDPDSKSILFVSGEKGEAPVYRTNLLGNVLHRYGKAAGVWSGIHPLALQGREFVVGSLTRVDQPLEAVIADLLVMDDNARTGPVLSKYEPRSITDLNTDAALSPRLDPARWNPSGLPPRTEPRSRASSSGRRGLTQRRNIR